MLPCLLPTVLHFRSKAYEGDRMVEAQVHDSENQLVSRIVRTYNPAGLITDERPVVENPAAMLLDKFPAEERAKFKTDPAALQALNKGLSTLMGGKAETGTFNTYDDDNRLTTVV